MLALALVAACSPAREDAEATADSAGGTPAPDSAPVAAAGDAWTVDFTGVGPVRADMTLEEARAALGAGTTLPAPAEPECDYTYRNGTRDGIAFMVVQGKIARVDISDSSVATAAGARIGDDEARIRALYGERVRVEPHKYTDGKYLIVPRGTGADTLYRLIFETDSAGRVTEYRAGRMPEVRWIEGCS